MTELLSVKQLAGILGISASTLYKHASGIKRCDLLHDLPPQAFRGKKVLWISQDIEAWLGSKRTFRPAAPELKPQPARRGRGRPRKYSATAGGEGVRNDEHIDVSRACKPAA